MAKTITQWADLAVAGILSKSEQAAAKQELLDHMEDHMADLMAAGFSREDAEKHTVFAMGDPEETAKLLRKAHQPILTRLIRIAQGVAICLAMFLVLTFLIRCVSLQLPGYYDPVQPGSIAWFLQHDPLPDSVDYRRVLYPVAKDKLGDYGVEVEWVSISHMPGLTEEKYHIWGGEWRVAVHAKFTRSPFSDQPVFRSPITLEDSHWVCADYYLSGNGHEIYDENWHGLTVSHEGCSPTADWYTVSGNFSENPDKITLGYLGKDLTLSLPIDLKGGVEYGQKP